MSRPASTVRKDLLQCIRNVSKNAWLYSTTPGKDFTRNRKLSFETMVKTLLCMEGGSLTNELMKRFGCHADVVSASAFVQQRSKILPEHLKPFSKCLLKFIIQALCIVDTASLQWTALISRFLQIPMIWIPIFQEAMAKNHSTFSTSIPRTIFCKEPSIIPLF